MSKDQVHINDLRIDTIIGVYPQERVKTQPVIVNVTLFTDHRQAAESDRIEDTIDYATLTQEIIELMTTAKFSLVERAASEIARLCLADSRVSRAVVRVENPDAIKETRSVGVTVDRNRKP